MMKKWLPLILLLLLSSSAPGGVPCTLPFNIQNGQPADATQVMANYNALVSCLTRAAAAGVNNDITALTALTSPIPPSGGGTTVFIAGTSTGPANAQILGTTTPTFVATLGYQVTFTAGSTNTGSMTLQVGSSSPLPVFRRTQLGISATVGGEVIAGQRVIVVYDGTQYQLQSDTVAIVGALLDYSGTSAPAGWRFADGSCVSRTQFADLFAVVSTTYDPTGSTCDVASFALPDARGRVLAGRDNMGTAANRLTAPCNGSALGGAGCGAQTITLAANQIPDLPRQTGTTLAIGSLTVTDSGHTHIYQEPGMDTNGTCINPANCGHQHGGTVQTTSIAGGTLGPIGNGATTGGATAFAFSGGAIISNTTGITVTASNSGIVQTGFLRPWTTSQSVTPTLPPLQVVNKIIKL